MTGINGAIIWAIVPTLVFMAIEWAYNPTVLVSDNPRMTAINMPTISTKSAFWSIFTPHKWYTLRVFKCLENYQ